MTAMKNTTRFLILVATFAAATLAGCACHQQQMALPPAVPQGGQIVGGGTGFSFTARQSGTLYVIDRHSNRLVTSKTFNSGERESLSENTANEMLKNLNIQPHAADPRLYFVPASAATQPSACKTSMNCKDGKCPMDSKDCKSGQCPMMQPCPMMKK